VLAAGAPLTVLRSDVAGVDHERLDGGDDSLGDVRPLPPGGEVLAGVAARIQVQRHLGDVVVLERGGGVLGECPQPAVSVDRGRIGVAGREQRIASPGQGQSVGGLVEVRLRGQAGLPADGFERRGRGEHLRHRGGCARCRLVLRVQHVIAQPVPDLEAESLDLRILEDGVDRLRDRRRHGGGVVHRRGGGGHVLRLRPRSGNGLDLDLRIRGEETGQVGDEIVGVDGCVPAEEEDEDSGGDARGSAPPASACPLRAICAWGFGVRRLRCLRLIGTVVQTRSHSSATAIRPPSVDVTGTCTIYSSDAPQP
jgi:hypothetical protein